MVPAVPTDAAHTRFGGASPKASAAPAAIPQTLSRGQEARP